jgi:hypothetical protein
MRIQIVNVWLATFTATNKHEYPVKKLEVANLFENSILRVNIKGHIW